MILCLILLLFSQPLTEVSPDDGMWLPRIKLFSIKIERPPPDPIYGIASYYSDVFIGKPMTNGEKFQQWRMIGAAKKVSIGKKARVTNLENQKSVIITITDYGPHVKGRILDLSKKAFVAIADKKKGLLVAKMEVIE